MTLSVGAFPDPNEEALLHLPANDRLRALEADGSHCLKSPLAYTEGAAEPIHR